MKKCIKVLAILLIITIFFITTSYGFGVDEIQGNQSGTGEIANIGNSVVKVLSTIGIVASVVVLIILGIKYMMGSVEEKSEYKKTLVPYIIGAGLVFTASSIAQIVYNLAKQL